MPTESSTSEPGPRVGFLVCLAALAPALLAVWAFRGFVTQDGPSHLYNAEVLARSLAAGSPFDGSFVVRWEPLPNWAGHALLAGMVSVLPPRVADRLVTTLTLAGLAAGVVWLRWRVAGGRGMASAAAAAALLAINVVWLLGFTSFLLGACLFPITLGLWWGGRDGGFSARRAAWLAGLTVLGYACHLVSLGLTAFGLVVLEALTTGRNRRGRAATTALALAPLIPLAWLYLSLARQGGGLAPEWKHLADPLSPRSWAVQLSWVDPVSLARRDVLPLLDGPVSAGFVLLAPVLWLAAAVGLVAWRGWRASSAAGGDGRLGWWVLGGSLIAGGLAGPDTVGASHGEYLQQRVVLLGLIALIPALRFEAAGRAPAVALTVALLLQSASVWDYALRSERTAGTWLRLRDGGAAGTNRRVAAVMTGIRSPFRANPLLHADGLLGVGTGNVLWNDYETRYYYFPVHFRPGLDRPDPAELEAITLSDRPEDAGRRARRWAGLLERHHGAIDTLVVWGVDPGLDPATDRWFELTHADGPLRVFRRRVGGH